jgi:aspartate kinase
MALIVQKYGGSSVADGEKIKNVARRVAEQAPGNQLVVVCRPWARPPTASSP